MPIKQNERSGAPLRPDAINGPVSRRRSVVANLTPAIQAVPEFTSDRLRLLRPYITARVIELALRRVVLGEKFFRGETMLVSDDRTTVKLALLVAYELNPVEDFQNAEEAMMRGICSKTLRARRQAREVAPL